MKKLASEFTAHVNKADLGPMAKTHLKQVLATYQEDFENGAGGGQRRDGHRRGICRDRNPDINGIFSAR